MTTLVVTLTKRLEEDFLRQDFVEERNFILSEHQLDAPLFHRTKNIIIEYLPNQTPHLEPQTQLFQNLEVGQHIQFGVDEHRYIVNIEALDNGRFFHARDVSQIFKRESRFFKIVIGIALLTILISFFLAYSSSRRIVAPLRALTRDIRRTQISKEFQLSNKEFEDRELDEIATVFNEFLHEMSQYLERERALVGMASHELKTPVSVVLGALEVLESQHTVSSSSQHVLRRIESAALEMSDNIDVLLKLSRRDGGLSPQQTHIGSIATGVLDDLKSQYDIDSRVDQNTTDDDSWVDADPVLVKMLLRNLIQNALQHTGGKIQLTLTDKHFEVIDQGSDGSDTRPVFPDTNSGKSVVTSNSGLGLYIVTMICDRLGWSVNVRGNDQGGSSVCVSTGAVDGTGAVVETGTEAKSDRT
ncbi:sensor histidine kinase [Arenicella chitinivorans]|nr:HAMP domain-containing sensor histidine kinase [Arenicella chitinivorans]